MPEPVSENSTASADRSPAIEDRRKKSSPQTVASKKLASQSPAAQVAAPNTPTPQQASRRPQGKFLSVLLLIALLGWSGSAVWNSFFRYSAHGFVTGRLLEISAPWPADLKSVAVSAGARVRQNDLLAIAEDPQLEAAIEALGDELQAAKAELIAQEALLSLAAESRQDSIQEIQADYYEIKGNLLQEQSHYRALTSKIDRRHEISPSGAISQEEIDSLVFAKQGLGDRIENLQQAVNSLEKRLVVPDQQDEEAARLSPWQTRIETTQAAIRRLREKQKRGELRAPADGKVVKVHSGVGERTGPDKKLFEFLRDDSLELVIFVRQDQQDDFLVGSSVQVLIQPEDQTLDCRVARIGDIYQQSQPEIQQYYKQNEYLLPVYLELPESLPEDLTLRVGTAIQVLATW